MKAMALLAVLALTGCGASVGRTTTTSASKIAGDHESVDLFVARGEAGRCFKGEAPSIEFSAKSAQLLSSETRHLDAWATCLRAPEMRQATVVVAMSEGVGDGALFAQRASNIKLALTSRGVDAGRVVINAQ